MLISSIVSYSQQVVRNGNTFSVQSVKTEKPTGVYYQDKDGIQYLIYVSNSGSLYIKRISKKTGKEYKYYLPKKV